LLLIQKQLAMTQKQKNILWIFLHVPKTGGTTFSDQIKANFKPEEVIDTSQTRYGISKQADRSKLKNVKALLGHATYYGIHKFFPGKIPCIHHTFLFAEIRFFKFV
ncbi:MAG: hypothetical protein US19_C0019G0016, partial [Candidatus Daviesbacteria bacterium GW2011_GWB1_36_5]